MRSNVFAVILGNALSLGAVQAGACAFHGYTPDPTLVDVLLTTEQAVIARLSASDPGRFRTIQVLLGPDGAEIPVAVTPATRVRLTTDPSSSVLLARDGAYGPWQELAVLDGPYRKLIEKVVARQSDWIWGGEAERLDLFAKRLNDPNPDIRRLALRELDRVQYGTLRKVPLPKVRNLRQDLETGDADLMPIRVLLAGLSQDRGLGDFLSKELDQAIHNKVPYLGAYATAMIELEGRVAIQDILGRYLRNGALPLETREKLLEALAVQYRSAPGATRRQISEGLADLLRDAPELVEAASRQFGSRQNRRSGASGMGATATDADR